MKTLITGASSGIGRDMALYLSDLGHDLILVARNKQALEEIAHSLHTNVKIIVTDLSKVENCVELYHKIKEENIDVLINNAGFGEFGKFVEIPLDRELEMIDLNIKSVHTLTKLVLRDMKERNSGYILNVSSSASFLPGPLMATYYATKAYVTRLSLAIYEELRRDHSKVHISILAPGPVKTNFNKVANVEFDIKSLDSKYVAKYAIDQMFKHKLIIIPGFYIKVSTFFTRFLSNKFIIKISYHLQRKKGHH